MIILKHKNIEQCSNKNIILLDNPGRLPDNSNFNYSLTTICFPV